MRIIAITGMPGSGKDTVRQVLEEKGLVTVTMRHVVQAKLEEMGLPVDNRNLRELATRLREEGGPAIIAELCIPHVREAGSKGGPGVVIDGIRSHDEVARFKQEFGGDMLVVAVFAPPGVRFGRLKKRGETWDMDNWEDFAWRDDKELGWGLGGAIALADVTLDNTQDLEEFKRKVAEWTVSLGL